MARFRSSTAPFGGVPACALPEGGRNLQKEKRMNDKRNTFKRIRAEADEIFARSGGTRKKLAALCALLSGSVDYYDWVGFYIVCGEKRLALGPFVGAPTEHVEIPFGTGICGQAAASGRTIVIQDVSKVTNYLSCAPEVTSEIVVPIYSEGIIVGELDIDSHDLSPFSYEDLELLEHICRRLSEQWDIEIEEKALCAD